MFRVFENRILTRIFGYKKIGKGNGEGFTMRNFMVNIVRVIKSRRLSWAE
jgi:hypothetical protein